MKKQQNPQGGMYLQANKTTAMFLLCWFAYFAANLARLTYLSSMAEIIRDLGFSNASAGLVNTGFFICYGAGQLLSGFLGDYIRPKHMVLFGLCMSGAANVVMSLLSSPGLMLAVWCANGLIQATLWTPILRIVSEQFAPQFRKKACVNLATTYPAASLLMYAGAAGLIAVQSWRWVFGATSLLLFVMAAVWAVAYGKIDKYRTLKADPIAPVENGKPHGKSTAAFPLLALGLMCFALVMQGILRDGVTGWVPSYLADAFSQNTTIAILSTTALPVVNLAGVYLANLLHRRLRSESCVAGILFGGAALAAVVLVTLGGKSYLAALLSFACITSCMMGINVMLVSLVPTYFVHFGRVSFIGGLTNAMVYVGSSIATWGIGAIVDATGWGLLMLLLLVVALAGGGLCLLATPPWKQYKQTVSS